MDATRGNTEARLATRDAVLILSELRYQLAPDAYDAWDKLFHACEYLVRGTPHVLDERVLERYQQYRTRRS